jgi:uncharacterized protein (DUF924 family)
VLRVIDERAKAILDVWFEGANGEAIDPTGPVAKRWFIRNDEFDAKLRERFADELVRAERGELGGWCATPRGTLAFIVLCDQLSRNCFRDTPHAFVRDPLALHASLSGIARGEHVGLPIPERLFFIMPLMHSESLAMHDLAEREFAAAVADAEKSSPGHAGWARASLDYERKHRAIVEKWGRYPHRNETLGRVSTEAEVEFLRQPGSSF